jgi:acyl-coenzyme A synthetase/AMP-(fatty) acid ligase
VENADRYSGRVPLVNPFLYLKRNADDDPAGIFARTADQTVTNGEALVLVTKIAFELRRLGVQAGEVVALDLPDPLSILFTEAVYHEAAISTVLPGDYLPIDGLAIRWMFTNRSPEPPPGAELVHVDSRFLQEIEQNPYGIKPREDPIETLRIVFSSGTTGNPKAIAMGAAMARMMDSATASFFANAPNLTLLDTGTARGIGEFYLSVKAGHPYLCAGGASPADLIRLAVQTAPRMLKGSPNQIVSLVDEIEAQGLTLPSIETVIVSGTAMPRSVADRMEAAAEGCRIIQNYGSTEGGGVTSRSVWADDPFDAGHPVPGAVLEIVDADDQPVPVGTVGRIRYRTPGMAEAYLGDVDASARAFRDGWFYPGDLGRLREDGGLTLAGREAEVLNAGGVKVDPNRLDDFALRHPGVVDACSFEYDVDSGLRRIGIALVTRDDFDAQPLVVALQAEFGVAAPKLVSRVDAVPRTATGKPRRRALSERYSRTGAQSL